MKNIEQLQQDLIDAGFKKLTIRKAYEEAPDNEELKNGWFIACYIENVAFLALQEATSLTETADFYSENVLKYFI